MKNIRQAGWRAGVACAAVLALTGCSGEESNVAPQPAPLRSEATGVVTDGVQARVQSVAGKGTAGIARATESDGKGAFTLSLTELTGPYLLANTHSPGSNPDLIVLTSVATGPGVVNITPLTTLLTSQLLGLNPGTAYTSFAGTANAMPGRITSAGIQEAQGEVTRLLREVYGVEIGAGLTSFIDTPFSAVAGDPMFDAIQSLNAKLVANGISLGDLASDIAAGVQACAVEQLGVSAGGGQSAFCPLIRSALPNAGDPVVLDYKFRNVRREELLVQVHGPSVVGVTFTTTAGTSSGCSGTACAGVSLGVPAADETRPIVFGAVSLTGGAGSISLNGTLTGAAPFVTLPTLPCADDRFIAIFDDHSALGECASTNDPLQIGGTFGWSAGPGRESFSLGNNSDPQPPFPRVEIGLDVAAATPTVTYVYYSDTDAQTFQVRNRYACQFAACNGVAVGPVTTTTSPGFPIQIFNVTLDNTALTGMEQDGTSTGRSLSLRASFTLLRDPSAVLAYPPLASCVPGADEVSAEGTDAVFNFCIPENDLVNGLVYRTAYDMNGMNGVDTQLVLDSDTYDRIVVDLRGDEVLEVLAILSNSGEQYRCGASCAGVTVSAPDAQGARTVDLADARLNLVLPFPRSGDRILRLTGGGLVVPAP